MKIAREFMSGRNARPCAVYFLRCSLVNAVKVGVTYKPKVRFRELAASSAVPADRQEVVWVRNKDVALDIEGEWLAEYNYCRRPDTEWCDFPSLEDADGAFAWGVLYARNKQFESTIKRGTEAEWQALEGAKRREGRAAYVRTLKATKAATPAGEEG